MALLYDIHCSACGCEDKLISDYIEFVQADGKRVCLPHPMEEASLERLGYKWPDAASQGRLVQATAYFCRTCCRMVNLEAPPPADMFWYSPSKRSRHETSFAIAGGLLGMAVAIAWRGWDAWLLPPGVVGAVLVLLVSGLAAKRRQQRNYRKQVGPLRRTCPTCHGNELEDFVYPLQHPDLVFHCPKCQQLSCRAVPGAISMS